MQETALDLTMQGFDLGMILRAFAEVKQFRALGEQSYPMCRALTQAMVGQCLEPNTMEFEELLATHRPSGAASTFRPEQRQPDETLRLHGTGNWDDAGSD
jgi:hypothetical protein